MMANHTGMSRDLYSDGDVLDQVSSSVALLPAIFNTNPFLQYIVANLIQMSPAEPRELQVGDRRLAV